MNAPDPVLAKIVDRLVELNTRRSDIDAEVAQCKQLLVAAGRPNVLGTFHTAAVARVAPRALIDWAAVARHLQPSPRLIAAHTRSSEPHWSVRIYGRG